VDTTLRDSGRSIRWRSGGHVNGGNAGFAALVNAARVWPARLRALALNARARVRDSEFC
jgi:hypothetical protein